MNTIGWAVKEMQNGRRVRRSGWNGKGIWLRLVTVGDQEGGPGGFTERDGRVSLLPWIGMRTADAGFVPWLCSQTDLLATDWELMT